MSLRRRRFSTSAFAPKYYPKAVLDYANTRGADKIIYAGYFPMGLSLERIMTEMANVPLKDEVWPKFLRGNAERVLGLARVHVGTLAGRGDAAGLDHDGDQRGHVPEAQLGLAGDVDGALGDEHVRPEVAVGARAPHPVGEVQEGVAAPAGGPAAEPADPDDHHACATQRGLQLGASARPQIAEVRELAVVALRPLGPEQRLGGSLRILQRTEPGQVAERGGQLVGRHGRTAVLELGGQRLDRGRSPFERSQQRTVAFVRRLDDEIRLTVSGQVDRSVRGLEQVEGGFESEVERVKRSHVRW